MANRQVIVRNDEGETKVSLPLGTKVSIDGGDVQATLIGIDVFEYEIRYQCAWWNYGELKESWVSSGRVKAL